MNSFNKHERLKSKKDIDILFTTGHSFINYPFKITWLFNNNNKDKVASKLLISVSKRKFSRAVSRNQIKRQIRESFRLNKSELYKFLNNENISINFACIYIPTVKLSSRNITEELSSTLLKLKSEIEKKMQE